MDQPPPLGQRTHPHLPALVACAEADEADRFAVVAPEGTPDDIIAKINKDIVAALNNPEVRRKYLEQAATPVGNSPAEAARFIESETKLWGDVIRTANVKLAN